MPLELVKLQEVKDWLNIGSVSEHDGFLARLTEAAEKHVARVCGRVSGEVSQFGFITGSKVEYFEGECAPSVVLTYTPVTAVATIKIVYGSTTGTESATSLNLDHFSVDGYPLGGSAFSAPAGVLSYRLLSSGYYSWDYGGTDAGAQTLGEGFRRVKVTYTGGYATTAIPMDLREAVCELVADKWRRTGRHPSTSPGDFVTAFSDSHWIDLVRPYIRWMTP